MEAVAFYVDQFGFEVVDQTAGEVELSLGTFHLHLEDGVAGDSAVWCCLETDNLDAAVARLRAVNCY